MCLARVVRVEHPAHSEVGVDLAIAVEFPAVDVLIPAALKFGGDRERGGFEIARGLDIDYHRVGIDGGIPSVRLPGRSAIRRTVLERAEGCSVALRVDAVLEGILWRHRLARERVVIRHDRERLCATPKHAPAVEVAPPHLKPAAVHLWDPPEDRPTRA